MFTPDQRATLRAELLAYAVSDGRIRGGAITGSGAAEAEDQWSDIDLAFGVDDTAGIAGVLSDWTAHMYERHGAVSHMDVRFGAWVYRVFLLRSTLQVDLAFVPASEFRPLAPTFRLVFGTANEALSFPEPQPSDVLGLAWLHAIHVRSCIARGHLWQAEYMISGLRDHTLALACIRHGLPAVHGRGMDRLPESVRSPLEGALVRQLDTRELSRAFRVAIDGLLSELEHVAVDGGSGLAETLRRLVDAS